ncbi:MAG: hypothetical protein N4J56_004459 [Chroococcidiopsis sp. SAG 2025]|uniref:FAD/NAD(P)-binding protein n=1 Tax=Chroococcidiopsis sp. SAG 2025 TaxID=171389 RepID=UPI002936FF22|nr:FAD/NAD(P)-binding protein [Chroococcidiopsis sp. SAG 2025]MDV2994805.1 hypothetical protein [Chroococcidiopsis sp. SAG 2025]
MKANSASLPTFIDLAIVGAGPHALTLVTHLLQKRQHLHNRFLVFDKSGTWLQQWQQQFAAFEIPHLRSPAVHHPDPNPYALRRFAQCRPDELFPPYDLPGTKLFQDFCSDVIERWQLQERVIKAGVSRIEPLPHPLRPRFRVWLQTGQSIVARRVVLATGGGEPQLPDWVNQIQSKYPQDRLCHSQQVNLHGLQLAGERVLIVGGGLTSGHLAVGAIARGAKVLLIARRQLQAKLFDADPGWLGPKYLKGFWAESDWEKRAQLIQQARNGGSLTPAMMTQLLKHSRNARLRLDENCQVVKAEWSNNRWLVKCSNGEEHECDRLWLATGTRMNVTAQPLLQEALQSYLVPVVNGLPVVDDRLRLPGSELFLLGGLSALQVGPVARNLSGARMASSRIVPALTKSSVALSSARSA